jgi:hypothetical protein
MKHLPNPTRTPARALSPQEMHRQHYFEANARRELEVGFEGPTARTLAIVALVVVSLGASVNHLVRATAADVVVSPVRSPVVEVHELPPMDIQDVLVDGFRAGFEQAVQQGCRVQLSSPVGPL